MLRDSWLRSAHDHPKHTAFALLALELDAAPVGFNRPARNGEPESHPAGLARPGGVHSVEALEDPLLVLRRDPRPGVTHLDGDVPGRRVSDTDLDRALRRRVLDRVVQQVDETLPPDPRVALSLERGVDVEAQALILLLGEDAEMIDDARDEIAQA